MSGCIHWTIVNSIENQIYALIISLERTIFMMLIEIEHKSSQFNFKNIQPPKQKRLFMCGLCGLIEEQTDWTHSQFNDLPRRQERYKRLAMINRLIKPYQVQVSDIQGVNYLVQTLTGKQAITNSLGELWATIHELTGRRVDVLDDKYLLQFIALNKNDSND